MPDTRTYADRAEYLKKAVAKRRRRVRELAIAALGGKCAICGYARCMAALDIHHRDPARKAFGISEDGCTRSWERVRREIVDCVLICANCHREIHAGVSQLPTETSG